jgi:hypothetical protein
MNEHELSRLEAQWCELESAGIPLEPPEYRTGLEDCPDGRRLTIRQECTFDENVVRELTNGHFAYVAKVFIRRNLPGKSIIRAAFLTPPWIDPDIELLEDPGYEGKTRRWYSFPGETQQFYPGGVLNYRIFGTLARGDVRSGVILALGPVRPPEKFRNDERIPVTLNVIDQWDVTHRASLWLWLHRLPTKVKEVPKSTRGKLHDHPDKSSN